VSGERIELDAYNSFIDSLRDLKSRGRRKTIARVLAAFDRALVEHSLRDFGTLEGKYRAFLDHLVYLKDIKHADTLKNVLAMFERDLVAKDLRPETKDLAIRNAEHFAVLGWAQAAAWLRKPEVLEKLGEFCVPGCLERIALELETKAGLR
jgi:hypothetical protein